MPISAGSDPALICWESETAWLWVRLVISVWLPWSPPVTSGALMTWLSRKIAIRFCGLPAVAA